jgi:hypothetical protein
MRMHSIGYKKGYFTFRLAMKSKRKEGQGGIPGKNLMLNLLLKYKLKNMKKYLLITITNLLVIVCLAQNQKFSITWSYGLAGGSKPSKTPIDKSNAITVSQANKLIKYFVDSSNLDFQTIYNGCQNRAMVMSLLLNKKGIKHYKIWNFDPYKISIFNGQDALDVDDVLKLKTNRILWDFHVAIAVPVKNNNAEIDTLIFDPSFSNKPLKISEWLSLQHSHNSYFTFLDPIWYNFVTLMPGTSFSCNGVATSLNTPNCFPQLLTGDFYRYDTNNQQIIAEELATNEQITKVTKEIIQKLPSNDPSRISLISTVSDNFISFKSLLQGNSTIEPTHPFSKYLNNYKAAYSKSFDYWTKQLRSL